MSDDSDLTHQDSILVNATPEAVYDLVSDVTRTGEWSPVCTACWWDDESEAGQVGAWFTGHNETPERTWETRSRVVSAERGKEFSWTVGGDMVDWSFRMAPAEEGATTLTESWHLLPHGVEVFRERYAEDAEAQIEDRRWHAHDGIPRTLAAIKRIAESSDTDTR
jgi:ribosome-associated toxin RatA of RatAB toxin-antitoxin module